MQARLLKTLGVGSLFLLAVIGSYTLVAGKGASAQSPGGPGNVVVVCSSCAFKGMPQEGHIVLMDARTGDIWAYSDAAVSGTAKPIYVGTLTAVGQPIMKKK